MWGGYGSILTPELLDYKSEQYPDNVGDIRDFFIKNYMGKRVTDCSGLIKGYMWYDDAKQDVVKNTTLFPDINSETMFQEAQEKGAIETLPEEPGIILWQKGHVGVYIGDGQVIEAHQIKHGVDQKVDQTNLKDGKWTHWLKLFIDI